jgi:hypothetical protein
VRRCWPSVRPCVVLLDELVVYIRQFVESQALSGGTYDSNLSFVQSLTEAAKLVPNAMVLASLPESKLARPAARVVWRRLQSLEAVFWACRRSGKRWPPKRHSRSYGGACSSPVRDAKARDAVCRAFADAYVAEGCQGAAGNAGRPLL